MHLDQLGAEVQTHRRARDGPEGLPAGEGAVGAVRRFHRQFERELVHELGAEAVKKLRRLLRVIGERGIDRDVAHARLRPM